MHPPAWSGSVFLDRTSGVCPPESQRQRELLRPNPRRRKRERAPALCRRRLPGPTFRRTLTRLAAATNRPWATISAALRCFFVLGLFALWVWTCRWVDEDSRGLKVRSEFWNSIFVATGVVGFIAVLCFPMFILGFLVALLSCGVPFGLYVTERNRRVPESSRIFTPNHLQGVFFRVCARLGIKLGDRDFGERGAGPPIEFIGKIGHRRQNATAGNTRQVENSKGFMAAKELVYDAILRRSTDIHLEPKEDELSVRLRIDGVMYPTEPFDRVVGDAVHEIFKVLGGMDITEKRRPQDGSFGARMERKREIDFRVATQGTRHGEKLSLRILDQATAVNTLAGLGMRKKMQESMRQIVHQPHGLLLELRPDRRRQVDHALCRAPRRRFLSAQRDHRRGSDRIQDGQRQSDRDQHQVRPDVRHVACGASCAQDPDVLMIGEIRDAETATIACQAANTGHMVFSTVHANDAITALYPYARAGRRAVHGRQFPLGRARAAARAATLQRVPSEL